MPSVTLPDSSLEVLDQGSGPVVLFVHGFPLSHAMWQPQIEAFSDRCRIIAPDLRGFGKSSVTTGTVTMRQFADDLAAMLDQLGIDEPVVFCGLSMGGYIAWQFAQHHAKQLRALILCDTKASADSEEAVQNRHKLAASVLKHGPGVVAQAMPEKLFAPDTMTENTAIVEDCKRMMLATDPAGIAAALRGMAGRPDMTSFLPKISVPTLVIVGEHDQITTAREMRGMSENLPDSTFVEVPDAGHMAPLEQPEIVNAAIRPFLERIQAIT